MKIFFFWLLYSSSSVCYVKTLCYVITFKKSLLSFIRPNSFSIFNIDDPKGLKYLTRLRLNLSHLRQHKFRHNFQDTLNPLYSCSLETESVNHFLLRCHFFTHARKTLLDNLVETIGDVANISESKLVNILLYGNETFNAEINATILKNTIIFLKGVVPPKKKKFKYIKFRFSF